MERTRTVTPAHLEARCRQIIDLMRQGAAALADRDAVALSALSQTTAALLVRIEQGWHLTVNPRVVSADPIAWQRLRQEMADALHASRVTQCRLSAIASAYGHGDEQDASYTYETSPPHSPGFGGAA